MGTGEQIADADTPSKKPLPKFGPKVFDSKPFKMVIDLERLRK